MDALIGYSGFVGAHLLRDGMDVYNSKTIENIRGKTYRTIYCSGISAEKWKANQDPESDWRRIRELQTILTTVSCHRFVLISTVDVYDASVPQSEEPDVVENAYATHPYGSHRRAMEVWANETFPCVFVFRLPALFGRGLKKNALYDLMNGNHTEKLRSNWMFQWYDVSWLSTDIAIHIQKGHRVVNLVTPPISLELVNTLLFPTISLECDLQSIVHYRIHSIYGYSHTLEDVLSSMASFVRVRPTRLLVSELAWSADKSDVFRCFLRANGLGEELVPSKHDWNMSSYTRAYSAQSLLYGVTIQIFQDPERFLGILRDRFEKLASVGVSRVVFGSPKQRLYSGEDAVSLFRRVGGLAAEFHIVVCVENNARMYGGNWLNTLQETVDFVEEVNHPYIAVNLDTGSMLLENETIVPTTSRIQHVQVSFPRLADWSPEFLPEIRSILGQLSSYTGYVSLETLTTTFASLRAFSEELAPFQRSQ